MATTKKTSASKSNIKVLDLKTNKAPKGGLISRKAKPVPQEPTGLDRAV